MTWGGARDGAGRKAGVGNQLTRELREKIDAQKLILFLQDLVAGKVKGASISERKDAAVSLLRKVLPDMSHQHLEAEVEKVEFKPFNPLEGEIP